MPLLTGAGVISLAVLPTAPSMARRYTRRFLSACKDITEQTAQAAELVVSELVTNSVRFASGGAQTPAHHQPHSGHADTLIFLALRHSSTGLFIEVYDTGNEPPVPAQVCDDAESGRGLMIVSALAKRLCYFRLPEGGKVVSCLLETP
jgi:two-component sensor histidine kinase